MRLTSAALNLNLSDHRPLQFIHIPKTAGSSIEIFGAANGFVWGKDRRDWPASSTLPHCSSWHIPRPIFVSQLGPDRDPYAGSQTFCVVRHPYTRLISEYLMRAMIEDDCAPHTGATCNDTAICSARRLNTWLAAQLVNTHAVGDLVGAMPDNASEVPLYADSNDCHLLRQSLHTAMCDYTLRFEALRVEFAELMAAFAPGAHAAKLPEDNAASCMMAVSDLTIASRDLLSRVYRRDFEAFGYESDVPAMLNATGMRGAIHEGTTVAVSNIEMRELLAAVSSAAKTSRH